jgi:hypothetical protein
MLFTFLVMSAQASTPLFGLEYAPSRAPALTTSLQTGTGLGEFDGTINPVWRPFIGSQLTESFDLTGTLGMASTSEYTQINEVVEQITTHVFRPSFAVGFKRRPIKAGDYGLRYTLGAHVNLPWVARSSSGYSSDEQASADVTSTVEGDRLRGFGFDCSVGAQYGINAHVIAGISWLLESHIGIERTTVDVTRQTHTATGGAFHLLIK